jgi:RNA polymerase-binding transcription factor DksA
MADIADKANDQAQLILEKQIELQRGSRQTLDIFQNDSGVCWECDAPVTDGRRWCSKECTESAERSGW